MPIYEKDNGITIIQQRPDVGGKVLMTIPTAMFKDLRAVAAADGVAMAGNDAWLVGEIMLAGNAHESPTCLNCLDTKAFLVPTGEKRGERSHVRGDGQMSPLTRRLVEYPCPVCRSYQEAEHDRLALVRAWVDDPAEALAVEADFWHRPGREALEDAVSWAAQGYGVGQVRDWLVMVGPFGSGKTALAQWLILQCVRRGLDAVYVSAERFKLGIREMIHDDTGSAYGPTLARIERAAIVVFDQPDWIAEERSGGGGTFTAEVFRDIMNKRYNMRRQQATVFLVNLTAWEKKGGDMLSAIYDRMIEGKVVIDHASGTREALGTVVDRHVAGRDDPADRREFSDPLAQSGR